jgi:hypothetical protein
VALTAVGSVAIPPERASAFDHGDVHLATGRIFVAHAACDSVEVVDGERSAHVMTIPGCPEASGVLCVQDAGIVFAAARGAGRILVIDAASLTVRRELASGPAPNGLAWDERRRRLLVADVGDVRARLLDPRTGGCLGQVELPGRPRWCVYEPQRDLFLVNVREPACVALLTAEPLGLAGIWPVRSAGPHGIDLDRQGGRALVASDAGMVEALDLSTGKALASVVIAGAPDAIWFNPVRRLLYVAIGQPGTVDVINTVSMRRSEQLVTEPGAHTTAFDRDRQQLAVFLPGSCSVALYREG